MEASQYLESWRGLLQIGHDQLGLLSFNCVVRELSTGTIKRNFVDLTCKNIRISKQRIWSQ